MHVDVTIPEHRPGSWPRTGGWSPACRHLMLGGCAMKAVPDRSLGFLVSYVGTVSSSMPNNDQWSPDCSVPTPSGKAQDTTSSHLVRRCAAPAPHQSEELMKKSVTGVRVHLKLFWNKNTPKKIGHPFWCSQQRFYFTTYFKISVFMISGITKMMNIHFYSPGPSVRFVQALPGTHLSLFLPHSRNLFRSPKLSDLTFFLNRSKI